MPRNELAVIHVIHHADHDCAFGADHHHRAADILNGRISIGAKLINTARENIAAFRHLRMHGGRTVAAHHVGEGWILKQDFGFNWCLAHDAFSSLPSLLTCLGIERYTICHHNESAAFCRLISLQNTVSITIIIW